MNRKDAINQVEIGLKSLGNELANGQSENLKRFLSVAANFHNYSVNNWLLIFIQCPTATRVAGYKTWQNLGRQVKKGAKSISILAPRKGKETITTGNTEKEHEFLYFVTVPVFDISATEGKELPSIFHVEGDPGDHLESLESIIVEKGIELVECDFLNGALGESWGGKIKVLKNIAHAQRFITLVHELAHELLHRKEDRDNLTKVQKETEAEAVSFVVGQAIGVNSLGQAADYLQLWKGDLELFTKCLGRIQSCAKEIITALTKSNQALLV